MFVQFSILKAGIPFIFKEYIAALYQFLVTAILVKD